MGEGQAALPYWATFHPRTHAICCHEWTWRGEAAPERGTIESVTPRNRARDTGDKVAAPDTTNFVRIVNETGFNNGLANRGRSHSAGSYA